MTTGTIPGTTIAFFGSMLTLVLLVATAAAAPIYQWTGRVSELLIAGRILTMYGSILRGMRLTQQDHSVLAERLFKKAEALGAPRQQVAEELAQVYESRRQLNAAGK